ncbi:[Fe-Fe] hydrogenase large subunit C-terminal domain-containing protein [Clostridium massiliamazoniense]|uniref:[Fe-Fe] hydrogenase large subunit C-terminal domain-containing protein n=1 Tax=Clostridium massiliamazoniense TaxID=1347366 RepID=UPI0006D84D0D|nr:[Fe-Fe] hydrogenase large subunit C-terminal domain-containing protein [Clostridium massiliamazoniense]
MNSKYEDLFESLIKAYYDGTFDETVFTLMTAHEVSPQETFKIITSLCGVTVEFDNDYLRNLKKAITYYVVNKRLIEKLQCIDSNCVKDIDNKFPCEKACPFNALTVDNENFIASINEELCLNCGFCTDACTKGKLIDKVELLPILDLIKNNKVVIAIVAPAIIGQFGDNVSMDHLRSAFISMGFTDMVEVAFAADILSIKEAVEFDKHVKGPNDLLITSCCCPMWVGMLRKVYGELIPNLSPSVSPMIAAGRIIKKLNPEAKVVFIGPCLAKKAEAKEPDIKDAIDFVLTFKEVEEIFHTLKINPEELIPIPTKEYPSLGGRSYARTGGVTRAIYDVIKELYPDKAKYFNPIKANGVRECKEVLTKTLNGEVKASFIEGMGCVGGCVGGPRANLPLDKGTENVDNFASSSAIKVPIYSSLLNDILSKLNINSLKDFEDEEKMAMFQRSFK